MSGRVPPNIQRAQNNGSRRKDFIAAVRRAVELGDSGDLPAWAVLDVIKHAISNLDRQVK